MSAGECAGCCRRRHYLTLIGSLLQNETRCRVYKVNPITDIACKCTDNECGVPFVSSTAHLTTTTAVVRQIISFISHSIQRLQSRASHYHRRSIFYIVMPLNNQPCCLVNKILVTLSILACRINMLFYLRKLIINYVIWFSFRQLPIILSSVSRLATSYFVLVNKQ